MTTFNLKNIKPLKRLLVRAPIVTSFFSKTEPTHDDIKLVAPEGVFAYHTVKHNQSLRSMDCTTKLVKKLFHQNFSSARTKTEAIVSNVLAPLAINEMKGLMEQAKFITAVTLNTSNRNAVKQTPILVRYFLPSLGIKTKIFDFKSIKGETSDIFLAEYITSAVQAHHLQLKLLEFVADNTNTNFGDAERREEKNVFKKLTEKIGQNLVEVGCGAHIVHNSAKTACDMLPMDVEVAVFSYFHMYTVRVEKLKDICEFVDVQYKAVLSSGATRWLSLFPAVERTCNLFDALKEFFKAELRCPSFSAIFFKNPYLELWFWFVHNQMSLFNTTLLTL